MQLLDHVSISVRDVEVAKPFYKAVMAALGASVAYERADAIGFGERNSAQANANSYISIFQSPHAAPDPKRHWCFRARSETDVRAFHDAGLAAGGSSEGAPGLRPHYHPSYFAAFLLDPEGNKIEAVYHRAQAAAS